MDRLTAFASLCRRVESMFRFMYTEVISFMFIPME